MSMSTVRSFLPNSVNNALMYYAGMARCYIQYYVDSTFSVSEISAKLYIGDLASASNCDAMKSTGITHILCVINGAFALYPNDFKYKIFHIDDDPWVEIGQFFEDSNRFLEDAVSDTNSKIMIHCQRGVSRSVTLLMAYMLYKLNQQSVIAKDNVTDIIESMLIDIKHHRPIADPNTGFIEELKKYVYRLNGYNDLTPHAVISPNITNEIDNSLSSALSPLLTTTTTNTISTATTDTTSTTTTDTISTATTYTTKSATSTITDIAPPILLPMSDILTSGENQN